MNQSSVSCVVPCRNECDHIETCLQSILAQEPLEVIVADGMSDDGTREILDRLARTDARLRIVDNPKRITPAGMNAGIHAAQGKFIAIMGAHQRYAPDYLRCSIEALEQTGADNVGGAMFCEADTWLQGVIAAAHHSPFSVGGARWHNPNYEGPADTVFGGVYRREIFARIGLFDEQLARNQDDELNFRLIRAGGKIWQSPAIRSWYRPRGSLVALFRQYRQYGYWKVRVIQKHRMPASWRHLVPATFVLLLILLPVLSIRAWLVLLVAYLVGNVGASILTAARYGWGLLPALPAVFACYHFGYGWGFLLGIRDLNRAPSPSFTELTRT